MHSKPVPSQLANSIPQIPLGTPQVQQRTSVGLNTANTSPQQQLLDRLPVNQFPPIVEEEAEVIRDTAKTPRHSPWLLDQLPANRLSPIVEEEEEVERDTARAIETQLKHLSVFIGYCET